MFGYQVSLFFLTISLLSLAISQTLTKWRFMVLTGHHQAESAPSSKAALLQQAITDPWLWGAFFLILSGAIFWYTAMTRLPLSLMLPMAGILSPLVTIMAHVFLKEPVSVGQMAAILLIATGVVWLGYQQ